MGICNSKASQTHQNQTGQPVLTGQPDEDIPDIHKLHVSTATAASTEAATQKPAELQFSGYPQTPNPASVGEEYPNTPVTPQAAAVNAEHPDIKQVHKYNSMEKPHRSAMRNSVDGKSETYSRRSSSAMSNVGFSVNVDTPQSDVSTERQRHFAEANSISLKKIVDIFYDKVLADPKIGPFFEGVDVIKLKRHQVRFMALAFGGKELVFEEDPNLNLRKVHYRLIREKGLNLSHWECFVGLFDETMEQLEKEIPLEIRQAASRSIRATRHYFVPIGQETEFTSAPIIDVPEPEVHPAGTAGAAAAGPAAAANAEQ